MGNTQLSNPRPPNHALTNQRTLLPRPCSALYDQQALILYTLVYTLQLYTLDYTLHPYTLQSPLQLPLHPTAYTLQPTRYSSTLYTLQLYTLHATALHSTVTYTTSHAMILYTLVYTLQLHSTPLHPTTVTSTFTFAPTLTNDSCCTPYGNGLAVQGTVS